MKAVKLVAFTLVMASIAALLFVVARSPLFHFAPFRSEVVNQQINYQLSALPVAALAALVTYVFAGKTMFRYLRLRRSGAMRPFIRTSGDAGRWQTDGWTIGLIMATVIGAVAFWQLSPHGFDFHWAHLLLVVPIAASNALVEEKIYRVSYVAVGASTTASNWYGLLCGSIVFGAMHYWGTMPNGLSGAVMSAVVGFVLAKSIQETRGIFWALTIHFLLDVAILILLLNVA